MARRPERDPRLLAVSARIQKSRIAAGLSQAELARHAGISTDAVSRIERGSPPALTTLIAIADALGVELLDLFSDFGRPEGLSAGSVQLARFLERQPAKVREAIATLLRDLARAANTL